MHHLPRNSVGTSLRTLKPGAFFRASKASWAPAGPASKTQAITTASLMVRPCPGHSCNGDDTTLPTARGQRRKALFEHVAGHFMGTNRFPSDWSCISTHDSEG